MNEETLKSLNDELFVGLSLDELQNRLSGENLEDRTELACTINSCWVVCDCHCAGYSC